MICLPSTQYPRSCFDSINWMFALFEVWATKNLLKISIQNNSKLLENFLSSTQSNRVWHLLHIYPSSWILWIQILNNKPEAWQDLQSSRKIQLYSDPVISEGEAWTYILKKAFNKRDWTNMFSWKHIIYTENEAITCLILILVHELFAVIPYLPQVIKKEGDVKHEMEWMFVSFPSSCWNSNRAPRSPSL